MKKLIAFVIAVVLFAVSCYASDSNLISDSNKPTFKKPSDDPNVIYDQLAAEADAIISKYDQLDAEADAITEDRTPTLKELAERPIINPERISNRFSGLEQLAERLPNRRRLTLEEMAEGPKKFSKVAEFDKRPILFDEPEEPIILPSRRAYDFNRYNLNSLSNPYGAGSPYKPDGLMNPYSQYGSPYSNKSWRNPYATDAPKLYDSEGNYRGRLSANPYDSDSTSNRFGRYGSEFSPDSINNPYGAGNPYSLKPIYVVPSR